MKTKKTISRRRFLKTLLGAGIFTTGLPFLYSFFLERTWFDVQRRSIPLFHFKSPFRGLRIVQFSDLHYGFYFNREQLKSVVNIIRDLEPDIVCFTGDLVEDETDGLQACVPILASLKAPLGKYAVLGNHDYWSNVDDVKQAMTDSGFQLLVNEHAVVKQGSEYIVLAGIDDALHGTPDLNQALKGTSSDTPTILLAHEPDVAEQTKQRSQVSLQLSGHSHGGQIRIPFIGEVVTPPMGSRYVQGLYTLEDAPLMVYTNRGIGTTIYPFRMNCRPEITVLDFV